jgi:hypothetical protein
MDKSNLRRWLDRLDLNIVRWLARYSLPFLRIERSCSVARAPFSWV